MRPYIMDSDGRLWDRQGNIVILEHVADTDVDVEHLAPFVIVGALPKGEEIKILIEFASHCWTEDYDTARHERRLKIMDHKRPRAFDPDRYELSRSLAGIIRELPGQKCYITPAERNYMSFDSRVRLPNGEDYRVFFSIKNKKGKWNRVRYRLELFVESAYPTKDPKLGSETSFPNIVSHALRGEMVKYHHTKTRNT